MKLIAILKSLNTYIGQFKKLKRAHQFGGAPHKPILLLAILEGVERGEISGNRIFITPELILCFREYWSKLVHTPHQLNFALPFFHLRSEPFWKLIMKPGSELLLTRSNSVKSLKSLNQSLSYAEIDAELFQLMLDPLTREVMKQELIKKYFPGAAVIKPTYDGLKAIQTQILYDDSQEYKSRLQEIQASLPVEEVEEELFVRGALFKRELPKMYNYTCAATGMRIASRNNVQMVDACHIIPFAISKDDTIGNGICLSPTLHRAFDRGIISLTDDYTIMVSDSISEGNSPYALKTLHGKPISLPDNRRHYPQIRNLQWHRKEVWEGTLETEK